MSASPQKWSFFERLKYSLGPRLFRVIFTFTFVLSIFAAGIGFSLYSGAATGEYARTTYHTARTAWNTMDRDLITGYMNTVFDEYRSFTQGNAAPDDAYLSKTGTIVDENYLAAQSYLKMLCRSCDVDRLYCGIFDRANNRMLFILDANLNAEDQPPGQFISFDRSVVIDIKANKTTNRFMLMVDPDIGYACSSSYIIRNDKDYVYAVFCGVNLTRVVSDSLSFMAVFIMVLLIVSLITAFTFSWYMQYKVVRPINSLASAAGEYSIDRESGNIRDDHFANINIRTGDEIQNLSEVLKEMEKDVSEYYMNMIEASREQERLSSEMEIAERIQEGTLPSTFPPFPNLTDFFDIYALMDSAKEVGGDFYDFFMLNEDQMVFLIADVSGKGIPGALFMMISKIMIFNSAKMIGPDPALILEAVNTGIMENNKAEMFVTVWLGILDIHSGRLIAANAGHEYPFIQKAGGRFELFKDKHGFVIGGMDMIKYHNYEIQLEKGDAVYVYTDGVPEAVNTAGEMYGEARIGEALNKDPERGMEALLKETKEDLDEFSRDTEQFDDITMLGLRYYGDTGMQEMKTEAVLENIPAVTDFVDRILEKKSCSTKTITQINIAVDELFSNVARYAYKPDTGSVTVRVETEENPAAAVITFIDSGLPYNPLGKSDPDVSLPAEEREIGGLGIFLVRKMMDDLSYEYKDGKNILKVRKLL